MIRPKLFLMAGIPGSGKTTWAKTYMEQADWVSSDAIRTELGHKYDKDLNEKVFGIFHHRIDVSLSCAMDVVADATFLSCESRSTVRNIADRNDAELHLILFQNLGQAVVRNLKRKEIEGEVFVPEGAMMMMLEKYESTLNAIPFERYNSVTHIGGFS